MKNEHMDIVVKKTKPRAGELMIIPESSDGAFERYTWFFTLYLSSVFILTSIGTGIRWLLTVI